MTDPALARDYIRCPTCGSWTRRDIAIGLDGVLRCGIGHELDGQPAPPSAIVGRTVYQSPSLRPTTARPAAS